MAINTIQIPAVINFSKNFIPVKFQSDSYLDGLGAEKENYRVYVEIWVQNATHTEFELVNSQNLPLVFGSGGKAETDLKDTLHAVLENAGPDYMDMADISFLQVKKSVRKFYLKYAESIDGVVGALTQTANFTVAYGGLSYQSAFSSNLLLAIQPDVADVTKDRFLRQGNGTQFTRTNQPQFLYFLNTRATYNATLKANFYFTDNSTLALNLCSGVLTTLEKFAFNVKFDQIISELQINGRICQKYEVWLQNDAAVRQSEIRTFFLDYQLKEYVRYFTYWSSWGAVNTLLTYGKSSSKIEIIQSEAQRIRKAGDDIKKGDRLNFDISLNNDFSCATGFVSRRELGFNRDFYLSPFKFRYTGGNLLPIAVTSKTISELNDGNGLYAQNFDYKYLFDDDCYTEGDLEDGVGIDGFFFNLNPANPTQGFNETDPTVPVWVKTISLADIANWNANTGAGGTANWGQITGTLTDQVDLINYLNGNYYPINSNPANYLTGITGIMVTNALGFTPYSASNPQGFVNGATNLFIKNQNDVQFDSKFYVLGGRFEEYLLLPTSASVAINTLGNWQFYVDEIGLGGSVIAPGISLGDLSDVDITGVANDFVLYYHSASGTYKFKAATFGGTPVDAYTKTETNNHFAGVTAITGYNKSNWDSAFGWGNHAIAGYQLASGLGSAAFLNASQLETGSTVAQRQANGYLKSVGFQVTSPYVEAGALVSLFGNNGDGTINQVSLGAVRTFLAMPAGGDTLQSVVARGGQSGNPITLTNATQQNAPFQGKLLFGTAGNYYINGGGDYEGIRIGINSDSLFIDAAGNTNLGYSIGQGYKLAVNGAGYFNNGIVINNPNGSNKIRNRGQSGTSFTQATLELANNTVSPKIGFHWEGVVASQIGMNATGEIVILNNPGNDVESLRANKITAHRGFKSISYRGLVGNYDQTGEAEEKIIWTIGDGWNTVATMYGLGYTYYGTGFSGNHQIFFAHAGNKTITFKLIDGSAYFSGQLEAPTIKATSSLKLPVRVGGTPTGGVWDIYVEP